MSIADKIKSLESDIVENKDKLTEATAALEENGTDETALAVVEELSETIESQQKSLAALKKAEAALASKAQPVGQAPAYVKHPGTNAKTTNPADLLIKSALIALESGSRRISPDQVCQERYGDNEEVKAVMGVVVKAAQNPAMTTVPAWAGALVEEGYGAFIDMLKAESILAQLSLKQETFNNYSAVTYPKRNPSATNNLAGAFRAEGDPIRVGSITVGSIKLTPKNMAVISTFTDEMMKRSVVSLENLIKDAIIYDTSVALDTVFLGNAAGTAVQPAGIANGLAALDTAASAGTSLANIQADLKGRLTRMATLNMGRKPAWIMSPSNKIALSMLLTATGQYAFPSVSSGVLLGAPIYTSTTVPAGNIYLIDQDQIVFAGSPPEFDYSNQATIHEEDTTPLPVVDGAGVAAKPVRSLWQTNSNAIKTNWILDWHVINAGAAQLITAASY